MSVYGHGGVMVTALDLRLQRLRVRLPVVSLSGNNLEQVNYAHVHASVTKQ